MSDTRIYVAASWRTLMHQPVVCTLKAADFDVYDFRNPPGGTGFTWKEVGLPNTTGTNDECNVTDYLAALQTPRAQEGFNSDMRHLENCDVVVLVLPCGASAHLELGWAVGNGKRTCIYAPFDTMVPELMYLMVDYIASSMFDLLGWLGVQD
jgi:hypothetical protein